MLVKKISFPIPLTAIEDIYDDNIDLFVDLENGCSYTVVVATCKNIISLIDKEKSNFLPPGQPKDGASLRMIIVRKLTMEVNQEAIEAYAEEDDGGYWLKLHHFASSIGLDVFDKLQKSQDEEDVEFDKESSNL